MDLRRLVFQLPNCVQLFVTPWSAAGLPIPHHLQKFAQAHVHCIGDAIQPSHPLMPSSPSALSFSQHQRRWLRKTTLFNKNNKRTSRLAKLSRVHNPTSGINMAGKKFINILSGPILVERGCGAFYFLPYIFLCFLNVLSSISITFFKLFFKYGPFLKPLLNLLQYCLCFMFWFLGYEACAISAPRPGIELTPPALEAKS